MMVKKKKKKKKMLNESFRQLNRFALSLGEEELLRIRTRIDNLNYLNGVCLLHKSRFYKILQTAFEIPANIYLFKVNNGNIGKRCEICSELTRKKPEQRQGRCSGVFIVNFEHISHLFLVFLLLTLNK